MAKEKKNEFTAKKVKKDIKAIIKKYPIEKEDSRIEKVYLRKKAISDYYDKNKRKIADNVLVDIYNKMYNPSILTELSIGLFSGVLATLICELLKAKIPYTGNTTVEIIGYIIGIILVYIFITVFLVLFLFFAYKKILSLLSYLDEVDKHHKETVAMIIKEREADYEKRDKNEPKRNKKNRKHK